MAKRLESDEELHLLVSPKSRHLHQGYGPNVFYITYPWSNERRTPRTLSEHLYSPVRLPLSRIDVFNTLMAPLVNISWSLVIHMKTMHAFTAPDAIAPLARAYRRMNYPRSARAADAIIINSESLRSEIEQYLEVDPRKLKLIYEAVDHDLFKPGRRRRGPRAGRLLRRHEAVRAVRVVAVAVQELRRAAAGVGAGPRSSSGIASWRSSAPDGTRSTSLSCTRSRPSSASREIVVFVGGVPLEETVRFYQAADVFVYPSLNETFGLPILEAMACGCPVVTSDTSAMPETAGGAAVLSDPKDPASIARAIVEAVGPGRDRLREQGLRRAGQFTWGATAAATLDVYREAAERRRQRQK